jgi:hypothetical protein
MTASAPIPPAARLADAQTLGLAVVHLEPEDPWIKGTFSEISRFSTRDSKPSDMFPVELAWAARRGSPPPEGHILSLSFSRNGLLLGMMGDFALWRAARSEGGKVSRAEHHGEGITSFPGSPVKGLFFIRNSTIFWSSDLDTAKAAVDMAIRAEAAALQAGRLASENGSTAGAGGADQIPILARFPNGARHAVEGAILNENGSLARIIELLPGEDLDLPAAELEAVTSLSFIFDATSSSEGNGEVTFEFALGTSSDQARAITDDLAARFPLLKIAKVAFGATPRIEPGRTALAVKATGLDSIHAPLIEKMIGSMKRIGLLQKKSPAKGTDAEGPSDDPN